MSPLAVCTNAMHDAKNNSDQTKTQPRNGKWPFNELCHWQRADGEGKHTEEK